MTQTPTVAARIALVGDRSAAVRSHVRIPALLDALATRDRLRLDAYWIPTEEAAGPDGGVSGFDAVWLLPGSPYRSEAGALAAVRTAREESIPFLGTCAGFQHMLLEYARTVCGLSGAAHAENDPGAADPLIAPLACSLVGHQQAVRIEPGSLAARVFGAERTEERYHCAYGPAAGHLDALRAGGMRFTGTDEQGQVRIAELPGHPFFLATLFQPELAGDGSHPHPAVRALAAAAVRHRG
ncbi:gamma-glutamyl-gamma-aminobutyrate hydrolase family protein [Streptomyces pactum]|uniref:CTP synthase (glutamine hydrolyzing) n=1 Tax=Streptomyces pactum TaxID=68249 RepID=A0ABS0NQJ0_9ACTN|nr:gamma-glutamyl-gamma-aminobutyrate hydrolase family protein [Streptomyces pactum]MBH5337469.1 gamma-glutamyl-gamma-aminobutyrate hydrolase family protein [Streptomyces pactum]